MLLTFNLLQNLDVDHDVEDITGKKLKAIIIISMLIAYLKKSLIYAMNLSIAEGIISETDVDFFLAVPAKAGERAKAFMQYAAKKVSWPKDLKAYQKYKICSSMSIFE